MNVWSIEIGSWDCVETDRNYSFKLPSLLEYIRLKGIRVATEEQEQNRLTQGAREHFLDFETAGGRLFEIMAPGGVAYHSIDLVDHRAYKSKDYHYWSFLSEDENWSDGVCNRLRSKEIRPLIEQAGFEILSYVETSSDMPEGFITQVSPHFLKEMTPQELCVTGVECVLKKTK